MANADNVKQMVKKLLEHERNNQIAVQLLMPSSAVNVAGENLTGLPNSIAEVMKSSRNQRRHAEPLCHPQEPAKGDEKGQQVEEADEPDVHLAARRDHSGRVYREAGEKILGTELF